MPEHDGSEVRAARVPGIALPLEGPTPTLERGRHRSALLLAAALAAALALRPTTVAGQAEGRSPTARQQRDSVIGTVRDAATGRPLPHVPVDGSNGRAFTDRPGERPVAWTDTAGRFVLHGLRPGRHVLTVERRPYVTARAVVMVPGARRAGVPHPPVLHIALRRGPPPRASLTGRWLIELIPRPTPGGAAPSPAPLRGTLTLRDTTDSRPGARLPDPTLFRLALGTFVGAVPPRSQAGAVDAPWTPGRTEEAGGVVFFGDSMMLRVGPLRVTHGDFMVTGRFAGDSAHGVWAGPLPADGSGPSGRFVMRRLR